MSSSLPAPGFVIIFYSSHSDCCTVKFHHGLNLNFPNGKWWWTSSHIFTSKLYDLFSKMFLHHFCPFLFLMYSSVEFWEFYDVNYSFHRCSLPKWGYSPLFLICQEPGFLLLFFFSFRFVLELIGVEFCQVIFLYELIWSHNFFFNLLTYLWLTWNAEPNYLYWNKSLLVMVYNFFIQDWISVGLDFVKDFYV